MTYSTGIADYGDINLRAKISAEGFNNAPIASNDTVTTNEDTDFSGMLSASDVDDDTLTYSVLTSTSYGTVSIIDPSGTQTVLANYPLETDVADQMGNFGDLTLYGNPTAPSVPYAGSPLYSNGIYAMDTLGQDISTPSITTLDNTNFQVDIEFLSLIHI